MHKIEKLLQDAIRSCSREAHTQKNGTDSSYLLSHIHSLLHSFDRMTKSAKVQALVDLISLAVRQLSLQKLDFSQLQNQLYQHSEADIKRQFIEFINEIIKQDVFNSNQLSAMRNDLELVYQQLTGIPLAKEIKNGDELRNINSYEYLRNFAGKIPDELANSSSIMKSVAFLSQASYNPVFAYGNIYTEFLHALEKEIETGEYERRRKEIERRLEQARTQAARKKPLELLSLYDEIIDAVYNNHNLAIERAYQMVEEPLKDVAYTSAKGCKVVTKRLLGESETRTSHIREYLNYLFGFDNVNKITPQQAGSSTGELASLMKSDFKQFDTCLPSIRDYAYKTDKDIIEDHFGTQGQIVDNKARVNPITEEWARVQLRQAKKIAFAGEQIPVTHVYFNNLPYDNRRGLFDFLARKEVKLTKALHQFGKDHPNVVVITLPATKGLLSQEWLYDRNKTIPYQSAYDEMFTIANGTSRAKIKDFYIDEDTKKRLYTIDGKYQEEKKLKELLDKSFDVFGFRPEQKISPVERQAVYFHFIKFELSNFILTQLQPKSFNMSCRDAIDRGGVSSAYYNLINSIQRNVPMSREEFERAVQGAPTLVKGRGMNDNIKVLWSTLDTYINAQDRMGLSETIPHWLREWRVQHALPHTPYHHLKEVCAYFDKIAIEKMQVNRHSIFSSNIKDIKYELAGNLMRQLQEHLQNMHLPHAKVNNAPCMIECEDNKWNAMHNGRLGTIVKALEKDGLIKLHRQKAVKEISYRSTPSAG